MPVEEAPTTELGVPGPFTTGAGALGGGWLDTWEDAPELRFPNNVIVYDKIGRDAQVDGNHRAIVLPIKRTGWRLRGTDVRPQVIDSCNRELGLDGEGGFLRRRREGIAFADLLHHALLMLRYGFMPTEPVYSIGAPAPGQMGPGGSSTALMAHLRKIAPRMPRSLSGIDVARDGGLLGIRQNVPRADGAPGWEEVRIPVERLAYFVNDREGADWTGRSMLRSAWPHWLIKVRLLKLSTAIVERNGMGVPVVTYKQGHGNRAEALRIAKAFRAGEEAGAAMPDNYGLNLVGTEGTLVDALPLIKYHDEAMGRAVLAMFLNLGHDRGARSLGDTFVDYFVLSLGGICETIGTILTEHVIRDFVELNYGEDEPYPELVADPIDAEGTPTAEALGILSKNGLLGPIDPTLADEVRRRYKLPKLPDVATGMAVIDNPGGEDDETEADVVPINRATPRDIAARAAIVATRMAELAAASA